MKNKIWKRRNRREIKSNFNRNEKFNIQSVPKHFESVTNESIKQLKASALGIINDGMNFKPGALKSALKSVDGQFEEAYSTLEGDYSARLTGLKNAYTQGLSDLNRVFREFQLQTAEHNIVFENYSKANEIINGSKLPKQLKISEAEIEKLSNAIKKLGGQANE